MGSKESPNKSAEAWHQAAAVFLDPMAMSIVDEDHSEREKRWITMGISKNKGLLIVCHTFNEKNSEEVTIRIFSCRKATKREAIEYGGEQ
jgi:uncharacterized DUF497 family protein